MLTPLGAVPGPTAVVVGPDAGSVRPAPVSAASPGIAGSVPGRDVAKPTPQSVKKRKPAKKPINKPVSRQSSSSATRPFPTAPTGVSTTTSSTATPTPEMSTTTNMSPFAVSTTAASSSSARADIGEAGLRAYRSWVQPLPSKPSAAGLNISVSPGMWPEAAAEIRRRVERVTNFYNPLIELRVPVRFIVGRFEDIEWACRQLNGIDPGRSVEQCRQDHLLERYEHHHSWAGDIAGVSVHWYLLRAAEVVDYESFLPRIEHEYVHTLQQDQIGSVGSKVTCWYHGMAEYLGILVSSGGDENAFVRLRNASVLSAPQQRPVDLSVGHITDWLNRASVPSWSENQNRCGEFDRSGSYHDAVLAAEWMVSQIGIDGVLDFQARLRTADWSTAVRSSFGLSSEQLNAAMADYMYEEIQRARTHDPRISGQRRR